MDIKINNVSYTYQKNSPFEAVALSDVSLDIPTGSYTALIGHTGSGKSTLLQHINTLLKPTTGELIIGNKTVTNESENKELKDVRRQVGTVFQFPESQLFEENILKDVAFGPKNYGASEEEAEKIAERMLKRVGIDESLFEESPFDLSGGQQRRVAIAGVLAIEPAVLILDEPTAGLDPKGQIEMMDLFQALHDEHDLTIILATHQMELVATYADNVVVLEKGKVVGKGHPREVFTNSAWLVEKQLNAPETVKFAQKFEQKTQKKLKQVPLTVEELADALIDVCQLERIEVPHE